MMKYWPHRCPETLHCVHVYCRNTTIKYLYLIQGDSGEKVNILECDNIGLDLTHIVLPPSSLWGLWGWMKSEFYQTKVDARDELFARILGAAASTKKCEDQLRRTHVLRTRVVKCNEFDSGILVHLLWNLTNLSFMCNKFHLNIKLKLKRN